MKEAEVGGDGGLGGGADGGERREGGERGRRLGEEGRRGERRRPEAVEAGSGGLGLEGRGRRRRRRRGRRGGRRGWDAGELLDHVAEFVLVDVVDRGELLSLSRRGGGGRRWRGWRWILRFAGVKRWLCDFEGALVELLEDVVSFVGGGGIGIGIGRWRFVHVKGGDGNGGRHWEIGWRMRKGFLSLCNGDWEGRGWGRSKVALERRWKATSGRQGVGPWQVKVFRCFFKPIIIAFILFDPCFVFTSTPFDLLLTTAACRCYQC